MLIETDDFGLTLEYFKKRNMKFWHPRFGTDSAEDSFVEIVKRRTSQNGVFSFKAQWDQLRTIKKDVHRLTKGGRIETVIWIYGRAILSQAISFVIAQQTGASISGAKFKRQPACAYDATGKSAQRLVLWNWVWNST